MYRKLTALVLSLALLGLIACKNESGTGHVTLSLTDAPIDSGNVAGVFITITGVEYKFGNQWKTFDGFQGPQTHNLLDLTGGFTALLGDMELAGGHYGQLRFLLDAPTRGGAAPANPGSYLELTDGTQEPLFVPSGSQSGFKAVGAFDVPVNGNVEITADFDARKSVVSVQNGSSYILKPTIRILVNNQAGDIQGSIVNNSAFSDLTLYAYEAGTWSATEDDEPAAETPRFPNAVTSFKAAADGSFTLAFLAAGNYDLVVAGSNGDLFGATLGFATAEVVSEQTTSLSLDTATLAAQP